MKRKILFVNDEMTTGGVARILNNLLSSLDPSSFEIDLLVLHKHGDLLNEIPEHINVIESTPFFKTVDIPLKECKPNNIMNKLRLLAYMKLGLIHKRIRKERKIILNKEYDIEFSAKEGFCTIFISTGTSLKKYNWVQVDYKESNYSKNHMKLMRKCLKNIDLNIACSEQTKKSYAELFGINNIDVIHNLVDISKIRELSDEAINHNSSDKIKLICVARFHHQKGLDRLIRVYSRLFDFYDLTIVGDGELKNELHKLAKDLNVFDKINWTGILTNPYNYIKDSDLFVLPSLYEGYPTIVIESLISTTPVLACKVAGINEQLTSKEYGFIVENDEISLYNKLDSLKNSKELLVNYKEELRNYQYENDLIISSIEKLFNK